MKKGSSIGKREDGLWRVLLNSLKLVKKKTQKPFVVAFVGLVGSGKSSVARAFAPLIGATVVEEDAVRVALRNAGRGYDMARDIVELAAEKIIKRGGNAILDADFVDRTKRERIEKRARTLGARVVYVRTYADPDVMMGRLMSARYGAGSFFGGASSEWKSGNRGAVVALREMWRRTPRHYRWSSTNGGRFLLRRLSIPFIAEVDTARDWRKEARRILQSLRAPASEDTSEDLTRDLKKNNHQ